MIRLDGTGKCRNGLLFLRKCAKHALYHQYGLPSTKRQKTSLMHPNSIHCISLTVIVRRKYRHDVRVKNTMCGADCWTAHSLLVNKLNLRIQPARRPQGKKAPKGLDVSKLKLDSKRKISFHQLYPQPFRCRATQFRGSRRELDLLSKCGSFFSCSYPRTCISQTSRLVCTETTKAIHASSGHQARSMIQTQYFQSSIK